MWCRAPGPEEDPEPFARPFKPAFALYNTISHLSVIAFASRKSSPPNHDSPPTMLPLGGPRSRKTHRRVRACLGAHFVLRPRRRLRSTPLTSPKYPTVALALCASTHPRAAIALLFPCRAATRIAPSRAAVWSTPLHHRRRLLAPNTLNEPHPLSLDSHRLWL